MELLNTSCCGVSEIDGLDIDPKRTLLNLCEMKFEEDSWDEYRTEQAFILFTDIAEGKDSCGEYLAKYIKEHKLGYTVQTRAKTNPNSGNKIKAWLWSPKEKELLKWYKKNS